MPTGIGGEVGWWCPSLDTAGFETTTLTDLSGNGNHGTLTNMDASTDWVSDTSNGGSVALDFNAGTQNVNLGDIAAMEGDGDFSFALWAYVTSTSSDRDLICKGRHAGSPTGQMIIWYDKASPNNWSHLFVDGGNSQVNNKSGASAVVNTWVHLAVLLEGGVGTQLFINGSEDSSSPFASSALDGIKSNSDEYRLGNDSAGTKGLSGRLDDIRFFDRLLTTGEISNLASKRGYEPTSTARFDPLDQNKLLGGGLVI